MRLYYEEAGHGPVVILLHAHSLDRRMWDPQFAELARHYRVIRYDMRGYGRSSLPGDAQAFTHANDLLKLMDALKISKVHLVGLSLGALVATDFLALHPERIASLAVASGAIHDVPAAPPETPGQRAARESKERRDKQKFLLDVRKQGVAAYKRQWLDVLMAWCGPARTAIRPTVETMLQDWSAWQSMHVEVHVLLDTPVAPLLAQNKPQVPVLVLIGRDDMPGSQQSSRALLHIDPKARVVYLENAGHLSNMETPQAFNRELDTFWNNL